MKAKFYFLLLVSVFAINSKIQAQCSVAINSLIVNGMSVSASASGTGDQYPYYTWDWDDSTHYGSQNSYATHTYATTGGYNVCVTYSDSANPFSCIAQDCDSLYIGTVNGIPAETVKAEIKTMPNPFDATLNISLTLNQLTSVHIAIYDITGKQVEKIQDGQLQAGIHLLSWKPEALEDGIYFVEIRAGQTVQTKKIVHTTQH